MLRSTFAEKQSGFTGWRAQNTSDSVLSIFQVHAGTLFGKHWSHNFYFRSVLPLASAGFGGYEVLINVYSSQKKFRSPTSKRRTDWKAEVVTVREGKRTEEKERIREAKQSEEEDAGVRKGRKLARHCGYPMNRPASAAGAEPSGWMRDQTLYANMARSTCGSQNVQNTTGLDRTTFGSWEVEKADSLRPRLQVELMKKCTPLWCATHVEVKR